MKHEATTTAKRLITVFGSINADMIFGVEHLPAPGQTLLAHRFTSEAGGKGANQAVAAARDGAEVAMVGAVGRDSLTESALAGLRDSGVDLQHVAITNRPTGCAAIHTDGLGRNQIVVNLGANSSLTHEQMDARLLERTRLLLLQLESPLGQVEAVVHRAKGAGVYSMLNLAPAARLPLATLRACGMVVVNEDEAEALAGWLGCAPDAASLRAVLAVDVVRTLGGDGAEACSSAGDSCREPARPIAPVDTTAAGDCFIGVLAAELARGKPLAESMHRAGTAAALCCLHPGSQSSLPRFADTERALAQWDGGVASGSQVR